MPLLCPSPRLHFALAPYGEIKADSPAPPVLRDFQATFKSGVNYRIAHNAYKQFLRDNGVRSARAVDCDIKDTALFYVKTAKELRLALDRLPVRLSANLRLPLTPAWSLNSDTLARFGAFSRRHPASSPR